MWINLSETCIHKCNMSLLAVLQNSAENDQSSARFKRSKVKKLQRLMSVIRLGNTNIKPNKLNEVTESVRWFLTAHRAQDEGVKASSSSLTIGPRTVCVQLCALNTHTLLP